MSRIVVVLILSALLSACAETPTADYPKIQTILVQPFQCSDPVIAAAAQNVFVNVLTSYSTARVVREGPADVVVEGTITFVTGATSQGGVGASAVGGTFGAFGSSRSAAGDYVSGITALATRDGEVIAGANWGQTLGSGKIVAPETVAREVAAALYDRLRKVGLEER